MTRKLLIAGAAAATLLAAAAIAGVGQPGAARGAGASTAPADRLVTVSGPAAVSAVPDESVVSAGVVTRAPSAQAALAQNAAQMQRVIAALKRAGGTNVQTQQVALYPQTNDRDAVVGYTAQNTVSARSPVADAGALVDAAVGAGANTIDGPTLDVSGRAALYRDALERAVGDARAKAEALAHAGGFTLGAISSVAEDTAPQPVWDAAAPSAARAAATPVEPGTQDVTADVTVSFEIA